METRLATIADARVLAALHAESFGGACWDETQLRDSLALPTTQGWVAMRDDAAQGFILCQLTGDEVDILTFCVAASARRGGIGSLLLQTVMDAARHHKVSRIFLEVAVDNQAALALYNKAGFCITGKRRNYYRRGGERIDAVMLEIKIEN